jgi:hypothetical protein
MIVGKSLSPRGDVPMGFDDVAGGRHRVGLVVGPVQPDPPALTAHADRLVLTEPGDIPGHDGPAAAFEGSLLRCLDPLRKDQRVIGDIRELPQNFRLIDRAVDAPADLAFFDPLR